MSEWGRAHYGDPCRECGYEWSITIDEAVDLVRRFPPWARARVTPSTGARKHPALAWSVTAYICHVVDNLRISAERLAGLARGADRLIGLYDPDLLAQAREYENVSVQGALWSLEHSVRAWLEAMELALANHVELVHPERGELTVHDVCRTNAHDVAHHMWDIERSLA